jgi:hypothetical protein
MAFEDNEVKWIREDERIRMRVRQEATEGGYSVPVEVENVSIKIVNFDMPFWSIVWFLIKVTLAAIPAAIVVTIVVFIFQVFIFGFLSALFSNNN